MTQTISLDELTAEFAAERLFAAATEGLLVQGSWHKTDEEGRHMACMLGSLHGGINDARDCPGTVMPTWLAESIPPIFDKLPVDKITEISTAMAERMAVWSVLTADDWERVRNRVLVNIIRLNTADATGQARDVTDAVIDFVNLGRPENVQDKLHQAVNMADYFKGQDLLRKVTLGHWMANPPLSNTDYLTAPAAFTALFDALDFFLPTPVEQDFTFTAYRPELITTRATNIVTARRLAAEQLGTGIRFENGDLMPPPPATETPASVLAAIARHDSGDTAWHSNDPTSHWTTALEDARKWADVNVKPTPQFSNTDQGVKALKELFGLDKPQVPQVVLDCLARYDGGNTSWDGPWYGLRTAMNGLTNSKGEQYDFYGNTNRDSKRLREFFNLPAAQ